MNRYRYDGTTEGLLTAIDHILRRETDPQKVELKPQQQNLFDEGIYIAANPERADILIRRFSAAYPENARQVIYVILSEKEEMETSILQYMHVVSLYGSRIDAHLTHPAVHAVHFLARKVGREVHRLKGLLRFAMLEDGCYFARMEPDFNIIQPLSTFFTRRLRTQEWFIYDVKRSLVSHWDGRKIDFGTLESFRSPQLAEEELQVQRLWKTFFTHIAIPERKNPQLQRSFMPMKYWKYLVEKE
ncbi:TIGR03915 family putative DNA repair protein [Prosthecochloris sp.]|uniref:TIGR03915 family putative DNA repair protein n=1 Tax=Prosthecochloris sp. TaxID=290513 RepID=UPI00257D81C4|nr:TIGR03915 family putative DNA repair protein [Prosthecochloris sp.]